MELEELRWMNPPSVVPSVKALASTSIPELPARFVKVKVVSRSEGVKKNVPNVKAQDIE